MKCSQLRCAPLCAFASALGLSAGGLAQEVDIVLAQSTAIVSKPGFPSNFNFLTLIQEKLSNDGSGVLVRSANRVWVLRNNTFFELVQTGQTGILGPNRSGPDAGHVFDFVGNFQLGPNGSLSLQATAGAPGSSGNPIAFWHNEGSQNVEFARLGVDSALGPNLGTQWRFGSSGANYFNLNHIGSDVLLDTILLRPDNARRSVVMRHQPGVGNTTCLVEGETGALGPNVLDTTSTFRGGGVTGLFPMVLGQRSYVNVTISGNEIQEGIWRICDGNPTAIALSRVTGALGPGTSPTAFFNTIRVNPRPISNQALIFTANYRANANAGSEDALFVHQNGSNQLVAAEGVTGALGPNVGTATFEDLAPINLDLAGSQGYAAFRTTILTPARQTGLWRVSNGSGPEPVILYGQTPVAGSIVSSISSWTVFANGDVIADTSLTDGRSGLMVRFARNAAPQIILSVGQSISVQTPTGPQVATLNSYSRVLDDLLNTGRSSNWWTGADSWAASNGVVLVNANLTLNNVNVPVLARLLASDQDFLFRNGFE
jgi:hypothetical protein